MGAVTGTLAGSTEFAGGKKLITVTGTLALSGGTSSDTITLNQATHGITAIDAILGCTITGGMDIAFGQVKVSRSGLEVTITPYASTGVAASDLTGATFELALLGSL